MPRVERTRQARVIHDAEKQTKIYRPNEHAACRTRFDSAHTIAHDADGRSGNEDTAAEKTIAQDGSGPGRESKNNAAQFAAEAAAGPEGLAPASPPVVIPRRAIARLWTRVFAWTRNPEANCLVSFASRFPDRDREDKTVRAPSGGVRLFRPR